MPFTIDPLSVHAHELFRDGTNTMIEAASAAAPLRYTQGFQRDANNLIVAVDTSLAVTPVWSNGFLRDGPLGPLIVAIAAGTMQRGFLRTAAGALVVS